MASSAARREPAEDDPEAAALDDAVNEAVAACDGDLHATVQALLVGYGFLETQLDQLRAENARLLAAVSFGYGRGRHARPRREAQP